jgi:hypothetical protein
VPVKWDDLRDQLQRLTDLLKPTQPGVGTIAERWQRAQCKEEPQSCRGVLSTAAGADRSQPPETA